MRCVFYTKGDVQGAAPRFGKTTRMLVYLWALGVFSPSWLKLELLDTYLLYLKGHFKSGKPLHFIERVNSPVWGTSPDTVYVVCTGGKHLAEAF